jgi:hypothetical protein
MAGWGRRRPDRLEMVSKRSGRMERRTPCQPCLVLSGGGRARSPHPTSPVSGLFSVRSAFPPRRVLACDDLLERIVSANTRTLGAVTATPLLRDAAVSVRYSLRGSGPLSRRRSFRLPSSIRAASKRRDQNVPADREYYRVPARVLPTHTAPSCATPAVCSAQGQDGVRAAAGTARIPLACNIQHNKRMQQAVNIPGAPSTAYLWLHHQKCRRRTCRLACATT